MEFEEGDTVMDVLKRTGVDIDVSKGYVAGIDGLYKNLIVGKTVDGCTVSMVSFQTIWQGNVSFMMGIKWNGCILVSEEICR